MGQVGYQDARTPQDVRISDIDDKITRLSNLAELRGVSLSDVIAIYRAMTYEARTRLLQEDGDYKDEHIAGICDAIRSLKDEL